MADIVLVLLVVLDFSGLFIQSKSNQLKLAKAITK